MSSKPKQPKRYSKRGNDAGALPSNYARPHRWKIDQDYLDKLSPSEREWLAHFNDAHYGGDFRGAAEGDWPRPVMRAIWVNNRAAREDAHALANLGGLLQLYSETSPGAPDPYAEANADRDLGATPRYLDSEQYKQARNEYRETLSPTRRGANPVVTPKHTRAKNRLLRATPQRPTPEHDDNGETPKTK